MHTTLMGSVRQFKNASFIPNVGGKCRARDLYVLPVLPVLTIVRAPVIDWVLFFKRRAIDDQFAILLYILVTTCALIGQFSGSYSTVRPLKFQNCFCCQNVS